MTLVKRNLSNAIFRLGPTINEGNIELLSGWFGVPKSAGKNCQSQELGKNMAFHQPIWHRMKSFVWFPILLSMAQ